MPQQGGGTNVNYEFHTLLVQTFSRGRGLVTRLSTEALRRHHNGPTGDWSHVSFIPRLVKLTRLLMPDCGGLYRYWTQEPVRGRIS